jgi:choline dehydrogenase-like flavoprotein
LNLAAQSTLSEVERETISLICETFVPNLESNKDNQKSFFNRSATSIGANTEMIRVIQEEFSTSQRAQLKSLFRLFENPFLNLVLNQTATRFSKLNQEEREDYLFKKFASSSIPVKRRGFQALKRLILFINYGFVPDGEKDNPNWKDIGYSGRKAYDGIKEGTKWFKPLLVEKEGQVHECDICIVGSGAGGSVFAEYLSSVGWNVIVVESGDYYAPEDFVGKQEYEMTGRLFEQMGRASTSDLSFILLEGRGLGGSTVVNWNSSIKPEMWLREEWQEMDGISGLTTADFEKNVEYVWQKLKVNRDESEPNQNNEVLFRGCRRLGYMTPEDYDVIWRNATGCGERCTFCTYGCQYGCKQSTSLNLLPEATLNGCKFIFGATVDHIVITNGRATGISAIYRGSKHFEVKCRAVVLAAGSINTPAVLLRSGIKKNAGRNLRLHPTTAVSALFDHPIRMWEGPPQTCKVTKYRDLDGNHHGVWLEAVPAHPALFAAASPWIDGRAHKQLMTEMPFSSATIILLREKASGKVAIDKQGKPICDYKMTNYDKDWMIKGIVETGRILIASGAKRLGTLHQDQLLIEAAQGSDLIGSDLDRFESEVRKRGIVANKISLFSAHIMGSARMGKDQAVAFCDDNAESYEVPGLFIGDASVFPTSPGINPMITIMSMARRNAIRIDSLLKGKIQY